MRTNIVLDDDLIARATHLTGIKTRKELVALALRTLIDVESRRRSAAQVVGGVRELRTAYRGAEEERVSVRVEDLEELRALVDRLAGGVDPATEELIDRAERLTGIESRESLMKEALGVLVRVKAGEKMRALRGKLEWEGDLRAWRENRFDSD